VHVQTLGSGSAGNATLIRADDLHVVVDAGLPWDELLQRFEVARVAPSRVDHVLVTHGHLDHARSAGRLAEAAAARLHCAEGIMRNASIRRAKRLAAVRQHDEVVLGRDGCPTEVRVRALPIPHDASPTFAFHLEHGGRRVGVVTDMGHPRTGALTALRGVHLLLLEFNHDPGLLRDGPYVPTLKRRVSGPQGHLSNEQAATVLRELASPELATLVLAHLSSTNNTRELARAAAETALADLGLHDVRVVVAEQDEVGPNLRV